VTRLGVGIALIVWIAWVMRRGYSDQLQMWGKALLIVAGLFMISPTQFPWYYLWVIPLLTIRPRVSLLMLNALLPFYYVRFYFKAYGDINTFDNYLVWLQYVPVWILITWEVCRAKRGTSPYLSNHLLKAT
jgi:alpha-1,6-mannosyltransferase